MSMAAAAISSNISREEMQDAIAKNLERRALHAGFLQRNNTNSTHPSSSSSSSPVLRYDACYSAEDYPVFTPIYEDEELVPGYHQPELKIRTLPESCEESEFVPEHVWGADDQKSVISSSIFKNPSSLQNSPAIESFYKSRRRRNSTGDLKSLSSRNIEELDSKSETARICSKNTNSSKSRGDFLAWLFPKLKKKHKNEPGELQILKKELIEANKHREAAVLESVAMKSVMEDLSQKLEQLETYCEGLKTALSEGKIPKPSIRNLAGEETSMENFLQTVSESRFSVKKFCKILLRDDTLTNNLKSLLQPYNLSLLDSRRSRAVSLYHLEAIMNKTLYRDFENCVFRSNGCSKFLDPRQDRQSRSRSFVLLRNVSWNDVLLKGTKFYSEEFSMFCDQKMNCIVAALEWTCHWPEQLLQAFFAVAKCVWLVHLLAFSFNPPISILRVEENRSFDPQYMEDVVVDRQQRSNGSGQVNVMVMPGFYVGDRVLRCKVLCKN